MLNLALNLNFTGQLNPDGTGSITFVGASDLLGPLTFTIGGIQNSTSTASTLTGTVIGSEINGGSAIINRIMGVAPGMPYLDPDYEGWEGIPGPPGQQGIPGFSTSVFPYLASTIATSGYPGDGNILWNNATQTSATAILISHFTNASPEQDIDRILSLIVSGQKLLIQDYNDSSNYQIFTISGTPTNFNPNTSTSYWSIPVVISSSGGTGTTNFANKHPLFIGIQSVGTPGAAGATGLMGLPGIDGEAGEEGMPGSVGLNLNRITGVPTGTGIAETTGGIFNTAATTFAAGAIQLSSWNLTGLSLPVTASFASFNGGSGSFTATDKSNRLQLMLTNNGTTGLAGLMQNSIAAPYTIDVGFSTVTPNNAGGLTGIGISDGTKYIVFYVGTSGGVSKWLVETYQTSNGTVATQGSATLNVAGGTFWLRMTDNATNRVYQISSNGQDFETVLTALSTTGFTTPTKFGMVMFCTSTVSAMKAAYYHFLVSSGILGDGS